MKFLHFILHPSSFIFRAPPVRVIRGPAPLTERELETAFGEYPLTHPLFCALLQLLDAAEDDANRAAAADLPANREKNVGGAEQLRRLRDDIFIRRENSFKRRGERVQDSGIQSSGNP